MKRNRFLYLGFISIALGIGLFIFDQVHGRDWFTFRMGDIGIPAGLFWILLGGLNMVVHFQTEKHIKLTDEEIRLHSEKLDKASPEIINLVGRKVKAGKIADRIEKSHGIPRVVTLKYIIAMGDQQKRDRKADDGS